MWKLKAILLTKEVTKKRATITRYALWCGQCGVVSVMWSVWCGEVGVVGVVWYGVVW